MASCWRAVTVSNPLMRWWSTSSFMLNLYPWWTCPDFIEKDESVSIWFSCFLVYFTGFPSFSAFFPLAYLFLPRSDSIKVASWICPALTFRFLSSNCLCSSFHTSFHNLLLFNLSLNLHIVEKSGISAESIKCWKDILSANWNSISWSDKLYQFCKTSVGTI